MKRRAFLASTVFPLTGYPLRRWLPLPGYRPVPSRQQLTWHRDELALFLHFGINTFTDREWGDGREDPAVFNPAALDARQWARAARSAGFRLLILTAKHHDGFCLWPSGVTSHSVASSPWRGGQGDLVREFTDACRAEGLKAGLYLSPWDRHEPSYGDSPRYNDFYIAQLTELLSQYGAITEVWFDGANGEGPNGKRQVYDWPRIHRTVRELQPEALIFSDAGPDIRWIGNEKGIAGDPNWCTMDPAVVPYPGADGPGIIEALQHGGPNGTVWRPGEADVSIRPGWFYHPAEDDKVRTVENLVDLYFSSVGRNAGLLLNVPPTREGLLHATDVARLDELGARIRALYSADYTAGAWATADLGRAGTANVLNPDPESFWTPGRSGSDAWLELQFTRAVGFNVVSLQEAIGHGQAVGEHRIEIRQGNDWRTLVRGSTIGHKRLHRAGPVSTNRVRLVIDEAVDPPRISRLQLLRL